MNNYASFLKSQRLEKKITQFRMAYTIGVSPTYLRLLENNRLDWRPSWYAAYCKTIDFEGLLVEDTDLRYRKDEKVEKKGAVKEAAISVPISFELERKIRIMADRAGMRRTEFMRQLAEDFWLQLSKVGGGI